MKSNTLLYVGLGAAAIAAGYYWWWLPKQATKPVQATTGTLYNITGANPAATFGGSGAPAHWQSGRQINGGAMPVASDPWINQRRQGFTRFQGR